MGREQEKLDYKKIAEVEIILKEENRNIAELTNAEVAKLEEVSGSSTKDGVKARTLLAEYNGTVYNHPIEKPKQSGSGKRGMDLELVEDEEDELILLPNPAEDEVIILLPTLDNGHFKMMDAYGRIMRGGDFKNLAEIRLDTRDLKSGLYIIELKRNDIHSLAKFIKK